MALQSRAYGVGEVQNTRKSNGYVTHGNEVRADRHVWLRRNVASLPFVCVEFQTGDPLA